jgi:hypothetical protein
MSLLERLSQEVEQLYGEPDVPFLVAVREFLASDGTEFDPDRFPADIEFDFGWHALDEILRESELRSSDEINALRLIAMDCGIRKECYKLGYFLHNHRERTIEILDTLDPEYLPTSEDLARGLIDGVHLTWRLADEPSAESPFEDASSNWIWNNCSGALMKVFERGGPHPDFFQALLRYRPEQLEETIAHLEADPNQMVPVEVWLMLIRDSEAYDLHFLKAVSAECRKPILAADVSGDASLADLEASIAKDKHLRVPKRKWMTLDGLVLKDAEGSPLSEKALYFLVQQQMKHKAIEPAPGVVPLLEHLPREQNSGVIAALLDQWIASDQAASERWVLTLAGLLGDGCVVPPIGAGIHRWCKARRKELAVCGVQALTLLGADEALMVLNDVAQRYTSKAGNVGRAAAEAFQAEADARGVDLEALRDMVVPDLGFDAGNVRVIASGELAIHALLQPDGTLKWRNPETGKETKNPPAKLPAEAKAEIKGLRALLRDTVKSQAARLELAMVCQRRWSMADWRALFEDNPLMRVFSSRLVFGEYEANQKLRSTFRRYPNGITADATGEMIELEDGGQVVGLVHPLELEKDLLHGWRGHLERFEIEPPFPQLTRPAHAFDPLHGNRKELQTVKGSQMGQGTLFSRSERLGWHRGSVVDGGELSSLYKTYASAGVEVILELSGFFMGGGWENWGRLEAALFVKAGAVERGSYVMDVPQQDDPRVLTFAEVSPIVYSETVADLKTIAGES